MGRIATKLQTEGGKEIYRQRKKIVEPVFEQMKFNLRLERLAKGDWIRQAVSRH